MNNKELTFYLVLNYIFLAIGYIMIVLNLWLMRFIK